MTSLFTKASAVGFTFNLQTVKSVFPIAGRERNFIRNELSALERSGFVCSCSSSRKHNYIFSFKNQTILEIAYSRLLFSQRVKLHHQIAECYEKNPTYRPLNQLYPQLAYHWAQVLDEEGSPLAKTAASRVIQYIRLAHSVKQIQDHRLRNDWIKNSLSLCGFFEKSRLFDETSSSSSSSLVSSLPVTKIFSSEVKENEHPPDISAEIPPLSPKTKKAKSSTKITHQPNLVECKKLKVPSNLSMIKLRLVAVGIPAVSLKDLLDESPCTPIRQLAGITADLSND